MTRAVLAIALAALALPLAAQDKPKAPPGTTKKQRDRLLALDAAAASAAGLPASKRLPAADAAAFDWVAVLGLTPVHKQGGKPNCVAQATVAALGVELATPERHEGQAGPVAAVGARRPPAVRQFALRRRPG